MDDTIETSADAVALFRSAMPKEQDEVLVWVLPLDANGKVLEKPIVIPAGDKGAEVTLRAGAIFSAAIRADADKIIVAHCHPGGNPTPNKVDFAATAELIDIASRLRIKLLDHLVLGSPDSANGAGFVSMFEAMSLLRHGVGPLWWGG